MRAFGIVLLALGALAVPVAAGEPPPAAADVRAFMLGVEAASRARDLERITAALSPDCRIELRARIDGREHVTLLTRDEYVAQLMSGFAALKDLERYDYRVTGLSITLETEPPGATVVSEVRESFVFGGRPFATSSHETARVERRAAELKLVAVSSETDGR